MLSPGPQSVVSAGTQQSTQYRKTVVPFVPMLTLRKPSGARKVSLFSLSFPESKLGINPTRPHLGQWISIALLLGKVREEGVNIWIASASRLRSSFEAPDSRDNDLRVGRTIFSSSHIVRGHPVRRHRHRPRRCGGSGTGGSEHLLSVWRRRPASPQLPPALESTNHAIWVRARKGESACP